MRALNAGSAIGFSLFLALASTSAWGLITFTSMAWLDADWMVRFETLRSVGFVGVLLLFGVGCLLRPMLFRRSTIFASTLLWIAGYTAIFCMALPVSFQSIVVDMAAICLGIAHALSFIAWQRVFFHEGDSQACRDIVLGSAMGGMVYLAMSLIGSIVVYGAAILLLIVGNARFLCQSMCGVVPDVGNRMGESAGLAVIEGVRCFALSSWRYALCIGAVGYVSGVARMIVRAGDAETLLLNVLLAAGMLVACIVLFILNQVFHRMPTFRTAYVALFFLTATGLMLLPFLGPDYYVLFAGVVNCSFTLASMFMMITCLRIAHLRDLDPVGTFGVFAAVVYAGVAIGRLVGTSVFGDALDVSRLVLVAMISVYVLSFANAIVGVFRGKGRGEPFDPLILDVDARDASGALPMVEIEPCGQIRHGRTDCPEALSCGAGSDSPISPRDICEVLARRYGLSRREADVLALILRGRDTAHIAEALFVSENTVKSHCKNVYRKLGVHNRQQVFDLAEAFGREGGTV